MSDVIEKASGADEDKKERIRENRLRRAVRRQGHILMKSRRRDPRAVDYCGYMIVDERNCVAAGGHPNAFSLDLDDVEAWVRGDCYSNVVVLEDNGGGLHIACLTNGRCEDLFHDLEGVAPGSLEGDVRAAMKRETDDWTAAKSESPAEHYKELREGVEGAKIVAELCGAEFEMFPEVMRYAAKRYAGIK